MGIRSIICASIVGMLGLPAAATCLSYSGECPFDIGDPDSAADFLDNFRSTVFEGVYATIDPDEDPVEQKRICILSCHSDFSSSEQACMAIPDTPTQSGNLRTSCLDQAVNTFNDCIRDECGITY